MISFLRKVLILSIAVTSAALAVKPLNVWIMPNGASPKEKLEQTLELYTQKTGIPTQVTVLDWGEAWNRLSLALKSPENAPDVFQIGTTWVPYFASQGVLKDLTPRLNTIDSSRFVPVAWNTTKIDGDSTIYAIPWFIDIRSVLCNKAIMKRNGISRNDVATYEGFVEAVKRINQSKEFLEDGVRIRAFAFPGKSDWNIPHNFAPWVWGNGGDFVQKENGKWKASILTERTLTGIAKYLSFVLDTLVNPDALQTNTAQIAQQFNAGELAFIINSSEIVMQTRYDGTMGGLSNARIGKDSIEVLPIPKGPEGSFTFVGGSNLAIPASNTRPEAIELIQFLTDDIGLNAYTQQIGLLPSTNSVLENWSKDEDYKTLVTMLETGRTYPSIPEWGNVEQSLVSMFSDVWDHLEIPALYSEDRLYEIFKNYSNEINKQLGYTETNAMTKAEFLAIWKKALSKNNPKEESPENTLESQGHINNNLRMAPWIFVFVLFISFIRTFIHKKKH